MAFRRLHRRYLFTWIDPRTRAQRRTVFNLPREQAVAQFRGEHPGVPFHVEKELVEGLCRI